MYIVRYVLIKSDEWKRTLSLLMPDAAHVSVAFFCYNLRNTAF